SVGRHHVANCFMFVYREPHIAVQFLPQLTNCGKLDSQAACGSSLILSACSGKTRVGERVLHIKESFPGRNHFRRGNPGYLMGMALVRQKSLELYNGFFKCWQHMD